MLRRKLLVALAGLAVVGAAGAVVLWPRPGVSRRNYHRITDGMSRAEVEDILGKPSGASYTRPVNTGSGRKEVPWPEEVTWRSDSETEEVQSWASDVALVRVHFDASERATGKEFGRPYPYKPSLVDWVWDLWHHWFP
jgi:hypothetical protein